MWRCVGCILFLLATGERFSFRFYFILFFLSNPPLQGEITAYASMTHHLAVRALDARSLRANRCALDRGARRQLVLGAGWPSLSVGWRCGVLSRDVSHG